MRSISWQSLLGLSMTLWLASVGGNSVTVRAEVRFADVELKPGLVGATGVAQDDTYVRVAHDVEGTQYLGQNDVAEAEADDIGEEPMLIRHRPLEADSFDSSVLVGISVRPDGTLGIEDVPNGGVVEDTEGVFGAAQENSVRTVEVDNHATVRPHLASAASNEDVLSLSVSQKGLASALVDMSQSPPPPMAVTLPAAQSDLITEANPMRARVPDVAPPILLAGQGTSTGVVIIVLSLIGCGIFVAICVLASTMLYVKMKRVRSRNSASQPGSPRDPTAPGQPEPTPPGQPEQSCATSSEREAGKPLVFSN